ncbi:MAG: DUF4255 domain-containing protein [Acidimicrobiales bacterium]|nr:DUF4255 domain-containing protein [Actinomycetota bacterium]
MIHEIDEALRRLIERDVLAGSDVEVVFDAPTKDWASRRNTPTIDCYLYDVREDLRRRSVGVVERRGDSGALEARHAPLRHFKLAYLLTAWTQRPEDEHRLLTALLACFVRSDVIPGDLLPEGLAETGLPIPVTIAQPPPENRQLSDVWSALGGELKPSLDLVVIAPVDPMRISIPGPPTTGPPRIGIAGAGGQQQTNEGRQPRQAAPGQSQAEPGEAAS